jgi:hypothetical protein
MSASAPPTNTLNRSFTICVSLLCSVAWMSCRSIETAEFQGKERDVRGWHALVADARQKKFSVVLVAAFDWVARSVKHFLQVMDEFDSLGIVFISRRENVDTSGPMGRLLLTLIGSIAELESDLIRERVLAGMRRAKLDGVRIGRAPMNLDRAAIVRDRLSGMSLTTVAKKWGIFPAVSFASWLTGRRLVTEAPCCRRLTLLTLLGLGSRVQQRHAGDEGMQSPPQWSETGSVHTSSADHIGKVFVVRKHGLRECLICGELFTRSTAPEHAEVDCSPCIEFCLLEPTRGGRNVTH